MCVRLCRRNPGVGPIRRILTCLCGLRVRLFCGGWRRLRFRVCRGDRGLGQVRRLLVGRCILRVRILLGVREDVRFGCRRGVPGN